MMKGYPRPRTIEEALKIQRFLKKKIKSLHLVDIESSIEIVLGCIAGYRIPEPLRSADRLSKKMKRDYVEGLY